MMTAVMRITVVAVQRLADRLQGAEAMRSTDPGYSMEREVQWALEWVSQADADTLDGDELENGGEEFD